MIGGKQTHIAVASINGSEMNVLDEVVEVEEGVCRTARRVLWVRRRFKKRKYLSKEWILVSLKRPR
jgi:hypothetical protein